MIEFRLYFVYTFTRAYLHNRIKMHTLDQSFDSLESWLNCWHAIKMAVGSMAVLRWQIEMVIDSGFIYDTVFGLSRI